MEFTNLNQNFTNQQKLESFLYLQKFILVKQSENKPFFIGRLSGNETRLAGLTILKKIMDSNLEREMLNGAGIQFLSKEDITNYVKLYNDSVKNCDVLGIWSSQMYEQAILYYKIIDKLYSYIPRICAQGLEPFYYMEHPEYKFQEIFKNKKVLLITSHFNTVETQLQNQQKIFPKPIFHTSTEFKIYKPPQQNGGNHDDKSWKYHFEIIKKDIQKINEDFNFDMALVSAGGFGMITSNFIYSDIGKSVIYIGGSLQLFFGIMGNRWQNNPKITCFQNKYWTSPADLDKPKNPKLCENGCYW